MESGDGHCSRAPAQEPPCPTHSLPGLRDLILLERSPPWKGAMTQDPHQLLDLKGAIATLLLFIQCLEEEW